MGELAEIKDSARIPNAEWSDFGVPYIRTSDITNEDASGVLFISHERYEFYKNKTGAPAKGDVLFNGGGEIGKTMLNSSDSPIYVQGGAVLYARTSVSDSLDGQYLKTYFETPNAQHYFETASAGGTMKHFTLKPSQEMPIIIPQMEEQKRIGECFSELDTLITLHQRKYEKFVNIKKSMLDKMFPKNGDLYPEVRINGFTKVWERRKLGDVMEIISGNAWRSSDYSDDGEYLVITIANVSGEVFINDKIGNHISCDNPNKYLLNENDILLSMTGNVGRVSKMPKIRGVLNQRVGKIVPISDSISTEFLFHVLKNPNFESAMIDAGKGAAQKNISNSDVLSYSFYMPLEIKEQQNIASCFDKLDDLIMLHWYEYMKLVRIKYALLKSLFV